MEGDNVITHLMSVAFWQLVTPMDGSQMSVMPHSHGDMVSLHILLTTDLSHLIGPWKWCHNRSMNIHEVTSKRNACVVNQFQFCLVSCRSWFQNVRACECIQFVVRSQVRYGFGWLHTQSIPQPFWGQLGSHWVWERWLWTCMWSVRRHGIARSRSAGWYESWYLHFLAQLPAWY